QRTHCVPDCPSKQLCRESRAKPPGTKQSLYQQTARALDSSTREAHSNPSPVSASASSSRSTTRDRKRNLLRRRQRRLETGESGDAPPENSWAEAAARVIWLPGLRSLILRFQ